MSIAYLKLFSGIHQDALVPIDQPKIIIGGRDDADIILGDQALKDKTFTVDVEANHYRLHNSSESLSWSSASLMKSGHTLIFYKTAEFIIGFSADESLFSHINVDNLVFNPYSELLTDTSKQQDFDESMDFSQKNDSTSSPSSLESNAVDNDEAVGHVYSKEEMSVDSDAESMADEHADKTDDHEDEADFFSNKSAWVIGVLAISISLFGIGYFSFKSEAPSFNKVMTSTACESNFKKMFADPAYSQLRFTTDGSANLIQGYVDGYDQLVAIEAIALKLPCADTGHIYSNQQIVSSIKNMLPDDFSALVKIEPKEIYGYFVIEGYAKDTQQWKKLKSRILQDVHGLISIEDKVETIELHLTYLNQLINKYELNGYVQLKINSDKIIADMVFNPSMYDKWTRLLSDYKQTYLMGPELVMDNVNITQLGIAGISQGKMAHIILSNGEKYIVGSVLPNGSVLTRVDDDGLVLSTAKGEIKYPVSTLF